MPKSEGRSEQTETTRNEAAMREVLSARLCPPESPSIQIHDCRIVNRRHRDGSRGTTLFEVSIFDRGTGRSDDVLVSGISLGGQRTRRLWNSARNSIPGRTSHPAGLSLVPFSYVPELDMLLQVFPYDLRLPALARLVNGPDPEIARALLTDFGPGDWRLEGWATETVQYRPDMRAILRLEIQAEDAASHQRTSRQYFAKVYRDSEQARRSYRIQRDLHDHVAKHKSDLLIAKPIALNETLNTVVTAALPGDSLARIVRRGDASEGVVRSAARAIAAFHSLDGIEHLVPQRPPAGDIDQMRQAQSILVAARPDLANDVNWIVDSVAAGIRETPVRLMHGDLKPEHILINGDQIGLLDFDLSAIADPVIDVAHLIAFLPVGPERAQRGSSDAPNVPRLFLDEYFAHMPSTWRSRLRLYHAMTSIHKAVGIGRKGSHDESDVVAEVIAEGRDYLLENSADDRIPSFRRRITRVASQ